MFSQSSASSQISLSETIQKLLSSLKDIPAPRMRDEFTRLKVSQTVSLFALLYEKVRTILQVKEEHIFLRSAIERIIKRRLSLNKTGKHEASNLLRELMWARYIPNGSVDENDIRSVQNIIDTYIYFFHQIIKKGANNNENIRKRLFEMMTCEIEEVIAARSAQREMLFSYVLFQSIRYSLTYAHQDEEYIDALLFLVIEKIFRKSDVPYQRYHLFILMHKPISHMSQYERKNLSDTFISIQAFLDTIHHNPKRELFEKYVKKQLPPFRVLFTLIRHNSEETQKILSNKERLWNEVVKECHMKYKDARRRVIDQTIRASIYIILLKILVAGLIEYPLYYFWFGLYAFIPVFISTFFFPFILWAMVLTFSIPGKDNTRRIYLRILDILCTEKQQKQEAGKKGNIQKQAHPYYIFFMVIYTVIFILTLGGIIFILTVLKFNFISQVVFLLFLSVVFYIAYRIRQVSQEYLFRKKKSILSSFLYMFFVPYISFGKLVSQFFSSLDLSFITNSIDFIIETPFKLVIEVFDEWSSFIREKKEDII